MAGSVTCSYCGQPFAVDGAGGSLLATCPHCGKQNTGVAAAGMTQPLQILHDAPNLRAGGPCPKCQTLIPAGDTVCVRCGYNLATHRKTKGVRPASGRKAWPVVAAAILLFIAAAAIHKRPPEAPEPAAPEPAGLAEQKARAEQVFRQKLDETLPLHAPEDPVDLRRSNGQVVRGTLLRFAGNGTNRLALVATEEGTSLVPVAELDPPSRLRLDPDFRDRYVRRMLNLPSAGTAQPENGAP